MHIVPKLFFAVAVIACCCLPFSNRSNAAGPMPGFPSGVASEKDKDLDNLVGKWMVRKAHKQFWIWTFYHDGNVDVTAKGAKGKRGEGKWYVEAGCVRIKWNGNRFWDTFDRPLNPRKQTGDSWDGKGAVHAVKEQ